MSQSPKQIAAAQVRSLRSIRKKLLAMAKQWEDLDEYNISRLCELADATEEIAVNLVDNKEASS